MSDPPSEAPGDAPSNSGRMVDGRFAPGHQKLGGKKVGSRHRATKIVDDIIFKNMKGMTAVLARRRWPASRGLLQAALKSKIKGMLPKQRSDLMDEPVETRPPPTAGEAVVALAEIYAKVASGAIDFDATQALVAPLQAFITATNVATLEREVAEARETIAALRAEIDLMRRQP